MTVSSRPMVSTALTIKSDPNKSDQWGIVPKKLTLGIRESSEEWLSSHFYLHNVRDDDLEAPDDHGLAGGDPAHGLGHEDAAEDAEDGLLDAEEPGDDWPVGEEGDSVQEADPGNRYDETSDCEPEDEDGVVDVSDLPVKWQ